MKPLLPQIPCKLEIFCKRIELYSFFSCNKMQQVNQNVRAVPSQWSVLLAKNIKKNLLVGSRPYVRNPCAWNLRLGSLGIKNTNVPLFLSFGGIPIPVGFLDQTGEFWRRLLHIDGNPGLCILIGPTSKGKGLQDPKKNTSKYYTGNKQSII